MKFKQRTFQLLNLAFTFAFTFLLILSSCDLENKSEIEDEESSHTIKIVTNAMDFQCVDTLPSGWNTFEFINRSTETHFFVFEKYPEGKRIDDTKKEVFPPFDKGMDLINAGQLDSGYAAFNDLPAWFFEVVFCGGSGLLSPKQTSITSIHLDPGYYIMECYVKMVNGEFHSVMGMAKEMIVSDEVSKVSEPSSDVNISISSTEGISIDKDIVKGHHVLSVNFIDQIAHENFVGHDVNLVKLDDNADLDALESWMNWSDPKGLISPSPEGLTFLGGVNDMSAGSTGYFEVDVSPGNYAFISEVPNSMSKNMLKTFMVLE